MSSDNAKKLSGLTAEQVLAISKNEPEWLFSDTLDVLKQEYRHLAKIWHPDVNKSLQAENVFRHIDALRHAAEDKIEKHTWQKPGLVSFTTFAGDKIDFNFCKKHSFALGEFYLAETSIAYVIRPEHRVLFENALVQIKNLPFADQKMRDQFSIYLPQVSKSFVGKEGCVLILKKEPELVCLRDVLDYSKPHLDPRHVAWTLSSLYNTSCYLNWANLTHNDISPDTIFISPKGHYGALLGGWWYATPKGESLSYLPDRSYDHVPQDIAQTGLADPCLDLGLIRLVGRELLGDASGLKLSANKNIPASLVEWLRMPTSGVPKDDYYVWTNTILKKSFGARRYTEMNLKFSDLYSYGAKPWVSPPNSTSKNTPSQSPLSPKQPPAPSSPPRRPQRQAHL